VDARAGALVVRWRWVRGHDGHAANEIVDALAQSAARGVPGPSEDDVVAALKASAVLAS
jgi:ribonuclease HI